MTTISTRGSARTTVGGSLGIAIGLAAVSYGHIFQFAAEAGAAPWEAGIIAATVDGLIVMAVGAIAHARRNGVRPPAIVKLTLAVGLLATTGANVHHGLENGWQGVVVSLWVPVAAELAYQLAMWTLRTGRSQVERPAICGAVIPAAALSRPWTETAPRRTPSAPVPRRPRDAAPASRSRANEAVKDARDAAALRYLSSHARPDTVTGAAIAAHLGVSERTGRRILGRLSPMVGAVGHREDPRPDMPDTAVTDDRSADMAMAADAA